MSARDAVRTELEREVLEAFVGAGFRMSKSGKVRFLRKEADLIYCVEVCVWGARQKSIEFSFVWDVVSKSYAQWFREHFGLHGAHQTLALVHSSGERIPGWQQHVYPGCTVANDSFCMFEDDPTYYPERIRSLMVENVTRVGLPWLLRHGDLEHVAKSAELRPADWWVAFDSYYRIGSYDRAAAVLAGLMAFDGSFVGNESELTQTQRPGWERRLALIQEQGKLR